MDRFEKVRHPEPLLSLGNAFDAERVACMVSTLYKGIAGRLRRGDPAGSEPRNSKSMVWRWRSRMCKAVYISPPREETASREKTLHRTLRPWQRFRWRYPYRGRLWICVRLSVVEVRGRSVYAEEGFRSPQCPPGRRLAKRPSPIRVTAQRGSIRQLNPGITATRPLRFFAYRRRTLRRFKNLPRNPKP